MCINCFSLFFCFKLVALKSLGPVLIKTQQFGFFGFFSLIILSRDDSNVLLQPNDQYTYAGFMFFLEPGPF